MEVKAELLQPVPRNMPNSTEWANWLRTASRAKFDMFKSLQLSLTDVAEKAGLTNPKKVGWYNAALLHGYSVDWKPSAEIKAAEVEAERKRQEIEAQKRAEQRIQQQAEKLVSKELDLPEELAFALNNLHLIPDASKPATWKVYPEDAPSTAAWNVLKMAATNPTKFMELITKELLSSYSQERKATGGTVASEDADLEEVRKMLHEATAGA